MSSLSDRVTTEIYIKRRGKLFELEEKEETLLVPLVDTLLKESVVTGEKYAQVRLLYNVEGVKYDIQDSKIIDRFRSSIEEASEKLDTGMMKQKQSYDSVLMSLKDAEAIEVRKARVRTNLLPSWMNR